MKYIILFISILFLIPNTSALLQVEPTSLTPATFKKAISTNVVVVEFGASFAKSFPDWRKLKNCTYYKVDIIKYPEYKDTYKLKTLPTIIIFYNGKQQNIFKANIMLEITATPNEMQTVIDKSLSDRSSKF